MKCVTLVPYGKRDYETKAEVLSSFNHDHDFMICDYFSKWNGRLINKMEMKRAGIEAVTILHDRRLRVCSFKLN